jgi:hypothetical protein
MTCRQRLLFAATVATCLAAGPVLAQKGAPKPGAQKKIYCWDDHGKKVCGDALPPEAAESARTEISEKSGLQTGQVARALTAEERAAAATASEQARIATDAEAARLRRDMAMVESYDSEADLRDAYGERINLVDASLKTSQLDETNLRHSLVGMLGQASDLELSGKPVPPAIVANAQNLHAQLAQLLRIAEQQRQDRKALDVELNDAVARYRALKHPAAATEPVANLPAPPQG